MERLKPSSRTQTPTSDCWTLRRKLMKLRAYGRELRTSKKGALGRLGKLSKNSGAAVGYLVRFSARALRDLAGVYGNVEAYGSDAALAWFQELEKAIYSLQRYPERGTRENKKHWILFFGRKPNIYKIIYKVDRQDAEVKVFHIRHGARRGSSR